MDEFVTKEDANVLTPIGFYRRFVSELPGKTREQAYNVVESIHVNVHLAGDRGYNDFQSFDRQAKRYHKQGL